MKIKMHKSVHLARGAVLLAVLSALAGCQSNYTGNNSRAPSLTASHAPPAGVVPIAVVTITKPGRLGASADESRLIAASQEQLRVRGAQALDCRYRDDGYHQHLYFWYRSVGYPQDAIARVSPGRQKRKGSAL